MAKLYIGLSGFSYKEWQGEGLFYPPDLKQAHFLKFYGERYPAVEADGTWYQMPSENGVLKWINETPDGFKVSPKMHRRVSHYARLKPEGDDSTKFFLERLKPLKSADKLGPILVQLPPNLKRDDDRLERFLRELPRPIEAQWAMEFRHDSWHAPEVEAILREHGAAWVAADTDDAAAQRRDTAPTHFYARLRRTDYDDERLREWSAFFLKMISEGRDCYVYCKHEDAEAPWVWADAIRSYIDP